MISLVTALSRLFHNVFPCHKHHKPCCRWQCVFNQLQCSVVKPDWTITTLIPLALPPRRQILPSSLLRWGWCVFVFFRISSKFFALRLWEVKQTVLCLFWLEEACVCVCVHIYSYIYIHTYIYIYIPYTFNFHCMLAYACDKIKNPFVSYI